MRRYVPELRGVAAGAVHESWKLPEAEREELDYAERIVDPDFARERFRRARRK